MIKISIFLLLGIIRIVEKSLLKSKLRKGMILIMTKQYYSMRTKNKEAEKATIDHDTFIQYIDEIICEYDEQGCFEKLTTNRREMKLISLEKFNKDYLLPYRKNFSFQDDDMFDLIEFFYDNLDVPSKKPARKSIDTSLFIRTIPISRSEELEGVKKEYRTSINRVLSLYGIGFELTKDGYIRELINNGLEELVNSNQDFEGDVDSTNRVKDAKSSFFRHGSTEADKRGAILEVAAVLEKLRDSKKLQLNSKDAGELFTILNSFNLRHNRKDQKPDYDKEVFYPWIFYNLLAAVDASLKLQRQ